MDIISVIDEDSDDAEDVKGVVDSVEISVSKVSVTVLESGSVDETEEGSVELIKEVVSVDASVARSVEMDGVSDE